MGSMESLPIARRRLWFVLGRAAMLFLALAIVPQAAWAASDGARLASLARDVDRVESVRNVKRIMLSWANYVDQGQWERAASLFSDDAMLQHGDDQFHGRADILAYFRRMIGKGTDGLPANMIHTPYLFTPIVTLGADGNTAKARWHAISMRGTLGGDASWQGGIFECVYVRQKGVWKIASQVFTPQLLGPYETGWSSWKKEVPLVPYHFEPADVGRSAALGRAWPRRARPRRALLPLEDASRRYATRSRSAISRTPMAIMSTSRCGTTSPTCSRRHRASRWRASAATKASRACAATSSARAVRSTCAMARCTTISRPTWWSRSRPTASMRAGAASRSAWSATTTRPAYWIITRFDNLYVKQGGKWRFDKMRLARAVKTDWFQGWAESWIATEPADGRHSGRMARRLPSCRRSGRIERPAPVARALPATTLAKAEAGVFAAGG